MPLAYELEPVEVAFDQITPSVHWAQRHIVSQGNLKRRIYDYELLFVEQGEMKVSIGGQDFDVTPGTFIYLPASVEHHLHFLSKKTVLLGVHYDYFGEFSRLPIKDVHVTENHIPDQHLFCREPTFALQVELLRRKVARSTAEAVRLMEEVIAQYSDKKAGYEMACRGLMLQLMTLLLRQQPAVTEQITFYQQEQLQRLARTLEQCYREPWNIERVSAFMHLHVDYGSKLFKMLYGLTPLQYLQHIRFTEAKRLLRESDLTIQAIADEVGYVDLPYFSRKFHEREGLSPLRYRKLSKLF